MPSPEPAVDAHVEQMDLDAVRSILELTAATSGPIC
jgi:hypothetical protein